MSEKILQKIMSGECSRSDFLAIRNNALRLLKLEENPKRHAQVEKILAACDAYAPEPLSRHYNFMGFCPGADFSRREDERWRAEGFAIFIYESQRQMTLWRNAAWGLGQLKEEKFETMAFGFGKLSIEFIVKIYKSAIN